MPLLDMRINARLVTPDPEGARGAIFLPAALKNVELSTGLCQTIEELFFVDK